MTDALHRLAAAHGIVHTYRAIDGTTAHASEEAIKALLRILDGNEEKNPPPPPPWPPPPKTPKDVNCFVPDFLKRGRAWGITCQLYSIRSRRSWGIGDLEDLAWLGEMAARKGADFLGVNPLHALFLAEPERASPFSPSDRNFLNPLYIAVDRVDGFDPRQDTDEAALSALEKCDLIDYRAVAQLKLAALRRIYRRTGAVDNRRFAAFREEGGEELRRFALFEAISRKMVEHGFSAGWRSWPEAYQEPGSKSVEHFAREHADDIEFMIWLQWIADWQLGDTASRVRKAGMRIGLYLDLAVGTAPDGAATWSDRTLTIVGAEIGAPPDMFNPEGQNWGLAPLSPSEIADRDFAPLRRSYENVLRHAGALRIDHAMGLYRLFWIPEGFPAGEGAYVLYPMEGIVRILAEVTRQAGATVIGEDLGVVPKGFRAAMNRANLLGYRVFYFERDAGDFVPPEKWPRSALACVGSHDTPTLAGWWRGSDIDTREEIGLFDEIAAKKEREKRRLEKSQAKALLRTRGCEAPEAFDETVAAGFHRLVASTPARLVAVQMEDLVGLAEQPNIPGTVDESPNWRRRIPVLLEEIDEAPVPQAVFRAVFKERPRTP
ncbi:4-alpha-glucanotransferase [Chelativorans salis]|uniref:4-alpha-glucanotransferase n=1 Tax=Chelativorans salis TaxID=2978478 RepID=A0ABT2LJK7_9HYPH|nr:4-alpha-glucanotransferase [Chelativorans sp. EGI FJ00035]MCT7374219.1 4-alpha-glucanotransferase [Chelativorans sp. EGI FJ00035]